jgi:trans-feruloyl-CoA hydratase/vanillin synthase
MTNEIEQPDLKNRWSTIKVEFDEGIAWVTLNRPEKRNCMNPTLNDEMTDALDLLSYDPRCEVLVLSGEGEAFSAGMDLKEYFRETDKGSPLLRRKVRRQAGVWQWRELRMFPKPTIAMVNGWCFGGAFTPLISCDLAISADEAKFGLSEINWGIIPAGIVTRTVAEVMNHRAAIYYIMTGEPFDGKVAEKTGLVNESVPLAELRSRVTELARVLQTKNPTILRQAKTAFKFAQNMDWDTSESYLAAMAEQATFNDEERGREKGLKQFLDDKTIKPGLQTYDRSKGL